MITEEENKIQGISLSGYLSESANKLIYATIFNSARTHVISKLVFYLKKSKL